jgi:imidazole glycerol-phosphate synthase subunit HisF
MLRPRIIPTLLVREGGLVKTVGFREGKYVGDPINAVKIFNEKEADELVVLDIDATVRGAEPDYRMISNLAAECRMPLCYGGGIKTVEQAERIVSLGVEKVALSSAAIERPTLLSEIAAGIGRQSVVGVIDVRRTMRLLRKGYQVVTHNARTNHHVSPVELAVVLEEAGAGEIVINSVDRDGKMEGYDLELAVAAKSRLHVPVTVLGGAGSLEDIVELIAYCGQVGASAGSLFVFKGPRRAVLINYPNNARKDDLCRRGMLRYREA